MQLKNIVLVLYGLLFIVHLATLSMHMFKLSNEYFCKSRAQKKKGNSANFTQQWFFAENTVSRILNIIEINTWKYIFSCAKHSLISPSWQCKVWQQQCASFLPPDASAAAVYTVYWPSDDSRRHELCMRSGYRLPLSICNTHYAG